MKTRAKEAKNKTLNDYLKKDPQPVSQPPSTPPVPTLNPVLQGQKRKFSGKLDSFLVKKSSLRASLPKPLLYRTSQIVGSVEPQTIFKSVPALSNFCHALEQHTTRLQLVKELVLCFLKHRKSQLWSIKYAPTSIQGLFSKQTMAFLKEWLDKFNSFQPLETLDQQFDQGELSSSENRKTYKLKHYRQKALILYGRQGVGKMTLIKSIAQAMGLQPHVCSNQVDRFQYLKQKDQSTKSQCVKIRKKQTTPSALITSFYPKKDVENQQKVTQSKSIQIIHEINLIYPGQKKDKFHQNLLKLMHQSMVPFIFTSSVQPVPQQYKEYQKFQFKQLNKKQLANFFWIVCHIENSMQPLYLNQSIEKQQLLPSLNRDFSTLQLKYCVSLEDLEQIVQILDFQYNRIFSFLQFYLPFGSRTILQKALRSAIQSAQTASSLRILRNIPHQHPTNNLNQTYKFNPTQSLPLESELCKLQQIVSDDNLSHIEESNFSHFMRQNWMKPQPQDLSEVNIKYYYNMHRHKLIKRKLIAKVNSNIINSSGCYSSFRTTDFCLVRQQQRPSRHRRQTPQQDYTEDILGADSLRYLSYFSNYK